MRRLGMMVAVMVVTAGLAGCATQEAMTVSAGTIGNPSPKYRNAIAVRTVSGGAAMNVLTQPGVSNEPLKAALEDSLRANGYLASGTPRYYVDAEVKNLERPLIGVDFDVVSDVTYTVSGAGPAVTYPIKAQGHAALSDSPMGADRLRIANERAMQANIRQFMQAPR